MAPPRVGLLAAAFICAFVAQAFAAQIGSNGKYDMGQDRIPASSGCGGTGCGIAFSVDVKTGAEKTLHNFQQNGSDGYYPVGGMAQIGTMLYGATEEGGTGAAGTVFAINKTTGDEIVLYAFKDDGDGLYPLAGLTKVGKTLYGTTSLGGTGRCGDFGCGNVFSIDPDSGMEAVIRSFTGADGYYPAAGLIAIGKSLFGTTNVGGNPDDCGVDGFDCVVFSLKLKSDATKVLYIFAGGSGGSPGTGELLGIGKLLYGTTAQGGSYDAGTIFSVDRTTGTKKVLHSFGQSSDGYYPEGGLTAVGNALYGTTCDGGEIGLGTVYSISPTGGNETVIFSFDGNDGSCPMTDLINVTGTLYGTTQSGGSGGSGTVFSIDSSTGTESVICSFDGADGSWPNPDLTFAHGKLYGTTSFGGP
jgi:uncharacterized repeat protein (TIGR03803 family)